MKKIVLIICTLFFFLFPNRTWAQENWVINNFHSTIKIEETGEVIVSEQINVDFGDLEKHGIYRDIPYVYTSDNGDIYTEVNINEVLQDGKKAETKITRNDHNINIRIGDADKTISGKHTYFINYDVKGVLKAFPNYDEYYWDVTGNYWEVPITNATAEITAENGGIVKATCFEGFVGSDETCLSEIPYSAYVTLTSTKPLAPGEGMTIAVALEKNVYPIIELTKPPTLFEKLASFQSVSIFSILLSAGLLGVFFLWWKFGRDHWIPGISGFGEKKLTGVVKPIGAHEALVVEFTPPENLPPALIGLVADERADTLDVTSTIIDLAQKGFLTITEIPKKWMFGSVDYTLKETKKDKSKLLSYERELLDRIFTESEIKISDLKRKFYDDLAKVKEKLYEEGVKKDYFAGNPEKIRGKFLIIGVLLFAGSIALTIFAVANGIVLLVDLGIAVSISGFVIIVFSRFMPRRTAYGREIYRRIKGYKMFIERAEKYRQRFFEQKNLFNEVLPYAIVFGLTEKFAKALADMGIKPQNPTWYHGVNAFNISNFSNEVATFSNSLSSAISTAPSSSGFSGGGSSGGGFGGGGGGSW